MRLIVCEQLIGLLNAEKAKYSSSNYKQIRRGLCKAIRIAHEMNSEDAEPVQHGRWDCEGSGYFFCNECKRYFVCVGGDGELNYCPNCGAKMRGDEDTTE